MGKGVLGPDKLFRITRKTLEVRLAPKELVSRSHLRVLKFRLGVIEAWKDKV